MAVARYTEVWFRPVGIGEGLKTAFDNLSGGKLYPLDLLSQFKLKLDNRFDQFRRGELEVHKILPRPDDLAGYTLAALLQENPAGAGTAIPGIAAVNHLLAPGKLGSRSNLPIGAGLGSSAAVVAATTVLFETLLDRPKTLEDRYDRVRFCERLKHGKAGPIDAAAVVRGGLIRASDAAGIDIPSVPEDHGLLTGTGWYWVLHGAPESSTGECVSAVRAKHGTDTALWDSFAACTGAFLDAISSGTDPDAAIRENQRLLESIGVVPAPAQEFVKSVEALGGAAKICGAGSVRGDGGGVVLVHLEDAGEMDRLMAGHPQLTWSKLRLAKTGAAIGPAPSLETSLETGGPSR
jgi:mevalonate kinase